MFGRDWERADATIITRRLVGQGHTGEGGVLSWQEYEYIADVRPDSGAAPFRATLSEPRNGIRFHTPDVGQLVRVKFNAKDQKVKFDHSDPGVFGDPTHRTADKQAVAGAHSQEENERFQAIANAAPGTPARPAGPAETSSASDGLSALPAELAATMAEASAAASRLSEPTTDLSETMAEIKRAKAAGDLAEVERLKSEFTTRAGQKAAAAHQAAARLAPQTDASDPLERLQKLGDLHERGVLTDAEFAAEKAKIVSEP